MDQKASLAVHHLDTGRKTIAVAVSTMPATTSSDMSSTETCAANARVPTVGGPMHFTHLLAWDVYASKSANISHIWMSAAALLHCPQSGEIELPAR